MADLGPLPGPADEAPGNPVVGPRGCRHVMPDGQPCGATRRRAVPFCWVHDPDATEAAAAARRLGGQNRQRTRILAVANDLTGVSTPEELTRVLEIAVLDALAQSSSLDRSRALLAVVRTGLRLWPEANLSARLRALEAAVRQPVGPTLGVGSLIIDATRLARERHHGD